MARSDSDLGPSKVSDWDLVYIFGPGYDPELQGQKTFIRLLRFFFGADLSSLIGFRHLLISFKIVPILEA